MVSFPVDTIYPRNIKDGGIIRGGVTHVVGSFQSINSVERQSGSIRYYGVFVIYASFPFCFVLFRFALFRFVYSSCIFSACLIRSRLVSPADLMSLFSCLLRVLSCTLTILDAPWASRACFGGCAA